ncbi:MAG: hypothetical protein LBC76_05730 [Treponema sp.]|nr:hypothetical protein [Treponema sp.]
MKKYNIIGFIFLIVFSLSFIGCNSLPKNVSRKEYDAVRDYVSIKIAGMPYWKLYEKFRSQEPPQYYFDSYGLPYRRETQGSDYVKYNEYMMEISNKMNQLTRDYNITDRAEDFYSWAIRN